jgi:hypothetical protein
MSKEDLKPFKAGEQRTKDLGRRGGKAKTKRKVLANRIKGYKQAKNKIQYYDEKIKPLLMDPINYAGIILTHSLELKKMADKSNDFKTKKEMHRLMNETYSTLYGRKELIDLTKVSLKITSDADVVLDRIAKYKLIEQKESKQC